MVLAKLAAGVMLCAGMVNSTPACDLYASTFVKSHTGGYDLIDGGDIVPNSGVFIEIFEPGEHMSSEGSNINYRMLYGVLYTDGTHYRILGRVDSSIVKVSVYSDVNVAVGTGTLELDPGRCGDGHHIKFTFRITQHDNVVGIPVRVYVGGFFKKSNAPVYACISRQTPTGLIECRKN